MLRPMTIEQRGRILSKVEKIGDGHWISGQEKVQFSRKRVEFRRATWAALYGAWPLGRLIQECSEKSCVNPAHFADSDDRRARADLLALPFKGEFISGIQFITDRGSGITTDFGCYRCGERFSPEKSRSEVLDDQCWDFGVPVQRGHKDEIVNILIEPIDYMALGVDRQTRHAIKERERRRRLNG